MQPFTPALWARLQATAQGYRENGITGNIAVKLNYASGQLASWDLAASEHGQAMSGERIFVTVTTTTS